MGNCKSRQSLIPPNFTVKLVRVDGSLLEFTHPIKVSLLVGANPNCFICSAEGMEFGQLAPEVDGEEVLWPGEVYFELPVGWRSQRMQADDMASLAVKASLALARGGCDDETTVDCGCCGSRSKVEPVVAFLSEESPEVAAPSRVGGGKGVGGGCKRRRKFIAELSAIIEE